MRKSRVAIICLVVVFSVLTGAFYAINDSRNPHLGVVSMQTLSRVTGTSSISSTNYTNNNIVPGIQNPGNVSSMLGVSYLIYKGGFTNNIVIMSYHFSSKTHADQYYASHSSEFQKPSRSYNDTYGGFTYTWYGNMSGSMANYVPFYAVGVDGSYAFLIFSFSEMTSNSTTVSTFIHDQVDSMV